MNIDVINLKQKASLVKDLHQYKLIAQMNNYNFTLIKAKRVMGWHSHPETDEVFIVVEGKMKIELRDKMLELAEGEMVVIPKGIEHRPVCEEEVCCLLIEPSGTLNTDNTGGAIQSEIEWI
ncbi:MAG: cupin domain-containing protein [Clostridia bacterium]|nr:cupin domain-containing protein [Clostridia bacterium]